MLRANVVLTSWWYGGAAVVVATDADTCCFGFDYEPLGIGWLTTEGRSGFLWFIGATLRGDPSF